MTAASWPHMTAIKATPAHVALPCPEAPAAPTSPQCSRSLLSVTSLSVADVSAILRLATLLETEEPAGSRPAAGPLAGSLCCSTRPVPAPAPRLSWRPRAWARTQPLSAPNPPPSKRASRSKTPASRCAPWGPSALFCAIFLQERPTSWSRSRGCRCSTPAMGCMSIHRRPCLT